MVEKQIDVNRQLYHEGEDITQKAAYLQITVTSQSPIIIEKVVLHTLEDLRAT